MAYRTHGYLLLDLSKDTDDRLVSNMYLPVRISSTIYTYIGDETDKVKLSRSSRTQLGPTETA
jgi:hypothetical protein